LRLRIEVTTSASELPWASVLRPGRSLLYDLLAYGAPGLGRRLHDCGQGSHGMVPFGHGAPIFPEAARRRGAYAAGGHGVIEAGSPVLEIVQAWADVLAGRELIDWGGVALHVRKVVPVDPPEFTAAGRGVRARRAGRKA
jgi:CRISPR-associated endoribonuclease Cas6